MKALLPVVAVLALTGCGDDPQTSPTISSQSSVMIDDNPQTNRRRFSRPVADVNLESLTIWHGHDLTDPKGLPTPDGLAASLGELPDMLEVPTGDWDKAVVYTGFGDEGNGNRFVVAHTLRLAREFNQENEAVAFYRDITIEAARRFGDADYTPSDNDRAFALWRIDDPTIDWGWPRVEARIYRNGKRIIATYQFFLQDRAEGMRRVGKMRPLGRSTQPSLQPSI